MWMAVRATSLPRTARYRISRTSCAGTSVLHQGGDPVGKHLQAALPMPRFRFTLQFVQQGQQLSPSFPAPRGEGIRFASFRLAEIARLTPGVQSVTHHLDPLRGLCPDPASDRLPGTLLEQAL